MDSSETSLPAYVRVRTTEATQLLGQAEATKLLRQTHFRLQTSGHLPRQRRGICPTWEGSARAPGESHLGSRIPQRLVCTCESADYRSNTASGTDRSYTASGTDRSYTASGTDPVSGSRHPGTFSNRGEVSAREGSAKAGGGAILCPGPLRD